MSDNVRELRRPPRPLTTRREDCQAWAMVGAFVIQCELEPAHRASEPHYAKLHGVTINWMGDVDTEGAK